MATRWGTKWWRLLVITGLVTMLAAACGDDSPAGGDETAAQGDDAPASPAEDEVQVDREASLRVGLGFGWTSLDPHGGPSFNMNWQSPLYDTLLAFDQSSEHPEVVPSLATSWTTAPDGLTVTFTLRDDVQFQDGTPFDASVVKANIERSKSMQGQSVLAKVESVEVQDATHAVFHLSAREPALLNLMAITQTGGMISPAAFGKDLTNEPAGSGPYKLVSANANGDTVYERWDGYWNKQAAYAKQITLSTVLDENARMSGLQAGTYDVVSLVAPDNILKAREFADYHTVLTPAQNQMGVSLNTSRPPFDDQRVREAVSMAFDRPLVAKQIMKGLAPPAYQVFWPGQVGYDERLDQADYDLDKAKELIDAAGASGTTVRFLTQDGFPTNALGQYVQQQLKQIGLDVQLEVVSNSLFKVTWWKGEHDGQVAALGAGLDPSESLGVCCLPGPISDNRGPALGPVAELAEEGSQLELGSAARAKTYERISEYLVENPGNDIPLVGFWSGFAGRPEVIGTDMIQPVNLGRLMWTYVGKGK